MARAVAGEISIEEGRDASGSFQAGGGMGAKPSYYLAVDGVILKTWRGTGSGKTVRRRHLRPDAVDGSATAVTAEIAFDHIRTLTHSGPLPSRGS